MTEGARTGLRKALDHLRSSLRLSARYYCPVCERPVAQFVPLPEDYERQARRHGYVHFGKGETSNVEAYSCPHCGAADRERLYALYLDRLMRAPQAVRGRKLLHFAPEPALSARIRRLAAFDYRTADPEMASVDDRVDISAMTQYPDASFDSFICSHVLEHVEDDAAALRELRRILRPDGWGILMVPLMTHFHDSIENRAATTEAERWRLFGQGDHVRLYAKTDFLRRVAAAGLEVQQHGAASFGAATFRRCGITSTSMLYVVGHAKGNGSEP